MGQQTGLAGAAQLDRDARQAFGAKDSQFAVKPRLLFDARKISDGGIGTYIRNALEGLSETEGFQITLLGDAERLRSYYGADEFALIDEQARSYSFDELFRMRKRIDFSQFDLFHTPHYPLPYGVPIPSVVTVHDLIHLYHPERFYYPLVSEFLLSSSFKRASAILTVSRSSAEQIKKKFASVPGIRSKVKVVPNALNDSFSEQAGACDYVGHRFGLTNPFFLCVLSQIKPHKGLDDLLDAFCLLKQSRLKSLPKGVELVLAGQATERLPEHEQLFERLSCIKGIRILGSVSTDDLASLYSASRAVVVASKAEGFGLPVLEAHGCGCPVVMRPVPALAELALEQDSVADDFSVEGLARAMEHAFVNEDRIPEAEVLSQKHEFSRASVAKALSSVYSGLVKDSVQSKS